MSALSKAQHRYKKTNKSSSEQKREKEEEAALKMEKIYPQCNTCKYHFKSEVFQRKHACCGAFQSKDALNVAMRYANTILATRNFTLSGYIDNMSTLFCTQDTSPFNTFKCSWGGPNYVRPCILYSAAGLLLTVWQEGIASRAKVSAEAVVVRLIDERTAERIRLAELPAVGQVRTSYHAIGQSKNVPDGSAQGRNEGVTHRRISSNDEPQNKRSRSCHTSHLTGAKHC